MLTSEQLYNDLKEREKSRTLTHPNHTLWIELLRSYPEKELRIALSELKKQKRIKIGNTINDHFIKINKS